LGRVKGGNSVRWASPTTTQKKKRSFAGKKNGRSGIIRTKALTRGKKGDDNKQHVLEKLSGDKGKKDKGGKNWFATAKKGQNGVHPRGKRGGRRPSGGRNEQSTNTFAKVGGEDLGTKRRWGCEKFWSLSP